MTKADLLSQDYPYTEITSRLGFSQKLPFTQNWSAEEDFIGIITDSCLANKPLTIVECSSGLTTLVLARCCQLNQQGHVFSLENGSEYVAKTTSELEQLGLSSQASILHAPLQEADIDGNSYQWYDSQKLSALVEPIDMLVIDGPPGFIQKQSRYPALPLLISRLAANAVVFLDDAARDDEQKIVERWLQKYPAFEHRYLETGRGCSMLGKR